MAPPIAACETTTTDLIIRRLGEVAHGASIVTIRGHEDEHEVSLSYTALLQYPEYMTQGGPQPPITPTNVMDLPASPSYLRGAHQQSGGYGDPSGSSGVRESLLSLELSITVCGLRVACPNNQWQSITDSTFWCLPSAQFSIDCFLRPNFTTPTIHRDFASNLDNTYSRDLQSSPIMMGSCCLNSSNALPAVTLKFDLDARSTLTGWFMNMRNNHESDWWGSNTPPSAPQLLPPPCLQNALLVLRISADCPIINIRAGPWKGLKNHGCTCYLNSLMQCLFHIHRFRDFVYQLTQAEDEKLLKAVLDHLHRTTLDWAELSDHILKEFGGDFEFSEQLTDNEQELLLSTKAKICGVDVGDILTLGKTTHGALQRLFVQMEIDSPIPLLNGGESSTTMGQGLTRSYLHPSENFDSSAPMTGTRTPPSDNTHAAVAESSFADRNDDSPGGGGEIAGGGGGGIHSSYEISCSGGHRTPLSTPPPPPPEKISLIPPVNTQIIECLPLILTFGWHSEDVFTQHDIQELNRLLIDKLEKVEKTTPTPTTTTGGGGGITPLESGPPPPPTTPSGAMKWLFGGVSESYIECLDVSYTSQRHEDFYDLQLDLRGDLYTSIQELHEVEILDNDNLYDSEKFGKQRAKKGVRILRYPQILEFHLKRFDFGYDNGCFIKINDTFEYDSQITLNQELYELIAVSVHAGDMNSGHYYSYINCCVPTHLLGGSGVITDTTPTMMGATTHPPSSGGCGVSKTSPSGYRQWYLFDDENVYRTNAYAAIQNNYGGPRLSCRGSGIGGGGGLPPPPPPTTPRRTDSAYILFYTKICDIEVDIFTRRYQGLLVRLYLEQAYKNFLEKRSALLQSSFIIKVADENHLLTQPIDESSKNSLSSIGVWEFQYTKNLIPENLPTFLRPIKEFALDFYYHFIDPNYSAEEISSSVKTVNDDIVNRPNCPQALYYLSLATSGGGGVSCSSSGMGSSGGGGGGGGGGENMKIVMCPMEYYSHRSRDQNPKKMTLGQNYTKSGARHMNSHLKNSGGGGGNITTTTTPTSRNGNHLSGRKDFLLIKVPLPTITPTYPTHNTTTAMSTTNVTTHTVATTTTTTSVSLQDLWRVWPVKVFDRSSLRTYFFGFAPVLRHCENPDHFLHSIYSTLSRTWSAYRERFLQNSMDPLLSAFLDKFLNTTSQTFFCELRPGAYNVMIQYCDQFYENINQLEPKIVNSVPTASADHTRIITLSFEDIVNPRLCPRSLRTAHILGTKDIKWVPPAGGEVISGGSGGIISSSGYIGGGMNGGGGGEGGGGSSPGSHQSYLEYYNDQTDCKWSQPIDDDTTRGMTPPTPFPSPPLPPGDHPWEVDFEDDVMSAADILRDAFTYLRVSFQILTKQECLSLLTEDCRKISLRTNPEIICCVDTRWLSSHLFTICAQVLSQKFHQNISEDQIILIPALDKDKEISDLDDPSGGGGGTTSRSATPLLTDQNLLHVAAQYKTRYYKNEACYTLLRHYGNQQGATGLPPAFTHLVPLKPNTQHKPIAFHLTISQNRITDSIKLIPYRSKGTNLKKHTKGLIFAINATGISYNWILEQVHSELNLSEHAQLFAYDFEKGQCHPAHLIEDNTHMSPTSRIEIIDGPDSPWLEVLIEGQPYFASVRHMATLEEVLAGLGEKFRSDAKYYLYNLARNEPRFVANAESVVIHPSLQCRDYATVILWSARLVVSGPVKPRKQMTLN